MNYSSDRLADFRSLEYTVVYVRRAREGKKKIQAIEHDQLQGHFVQFISENNDTSTSFPLAHQGLHFARESRCNSWHLALPFNENARWWYSADLVLFIWALERYNIVKHKTRREEFTASSIQQQQKHKQS